MKKLILSCLIIGSIQAGEFSDQQDFNYENTRALCYYLLNTDAEGPPEVLLQVVLPKVKDKVDKLRESDDELHQKTYKKLLKCSSTNNFSSVVDKEYSKKIMHEILQDSVHDYLDENQQQINALIAESSRKVSPITVAYISGLFTLLGAILSGLITWFASL